MPARVWVLLALLIVNCCAQRDNIRIGFLGCRFSEVCQQNEICVNDRLFGNCQPVDQQVDSYRYFLDLDTLRVLEDGIYELIQGGQTWENFYTQCVLTSILLAYRLQRQPDLSPCIQASASDFPDTLDDSAINLLAQYFKDYYDDINSNLNNVDRTLDYSDFNSPQLNIYNKKDELVNLHKYQHRNSDRAGGLTKDLFNMPKKMYPSPDMSNESQMANNIDLDQILENADPGDLFVLRSYLNTLKDLVEETSEEDNVEEPDNSSIKIVADDSNVAAQQSDIQRGGDGDGVAESRGVDDGASMHILDKSWHDDNDDLMSPEDAKLLQDLLAGEVNVDQLSDEQVDKLTHYVTAMLSERRDDADKGGAAIEEVDEEEPRDDLSDIHLETDGIHDGPVANHRVTVKLQGEKKSHIIDQHDHSFDDPAPPHQDEAANYNIVDTNYAYIKTKQGFQNKQQAEDLVLELAREVGLPDGDVSNLSIDNETQMVTFRVNPDNPRHINASRIAYQAMAHIGDLQSHSGLEVEQAGLGKEENRIDINDHDQATTPKYFVLTFVISGCIAGVVIAVIVIYLIKRHTRSKEKLQQISTSPGPDGATKDYSDLCRQHMQAKGSEKPEPLHAAATRIGSVGEQAQHSPSSRSSTSSWSEEPVVSNMDISTGHIVLSYMEDHLKNKDRLEQEWDGLCAYEAEPNSCDVAQANSRQNRYADILPYDHSRVVLTTAANVAGLDYINASTITDHDPRNPAYIATQGPLPHTVADFWQMVWEQGSVVVVMLTKMTENGVAFCHRYWPEEGSELYHIYEVHLVSEHIWCDDYLVRSFYLKNLQTNETRTVTQFHFLTWSDLGVPASSKALLDFRRKVNKSYRGRSCPIVVHCSDGVGRTGTYCLIDMVLNRMAKGAKEIDIAATLEHIRDQRMGMVKTKEQFEFVLSSVAEEVHAILKALPQ